LKKTILFLFSLYNLNAHAQSPDSDIIQSMETAIGKGVYPNIHSILISRDGNLVYEKYWPGRDKKAGVDLGVIAHGRDSLHGQQSVTKSFVSACVGIALEQGKIKNIHQKIFDFFPEYARQDTGIKSGITIRDLLTMTSGLTWNEEDYNDPANDENQMEINPDPLGYVLSRPMVYVPGKIFTYNGGATQLLAAIVQKATGQRIDSFANEFLFLPLGISEFNWTTTINSNLPDACSGLYIKSADMLRFGLLYLHDGKWKTNQILPAHWVKESLTPYITVDDDAAGDFGVFEYGFLWWLKTDTIMNRQIPMAECEGNGGQRIFVDKTNKIVVVFTGGNYRNPRTFLIPFHILTKYIYPAVLQKGMK
jgi:CubicO group peptidase (beta-lactamase class C family)